MDSRSVTAHTLSVNIGLIIQTKSDRELRNTHVMVLSKYSELDGVNALEFGE